MYLNQQTETEHLSIVKVQGAAHELKKWEEYTAVY